MSSGMDEVSRLTQVWTHVHDRATKWPNNSAKISATNLVTWFKHCLVDPGLAQAIAITPYTNPEIWAPYLAYDEAMATLLAHSASLVDRQAELGFPIFAGVEANIIPVHPGRTDHYEFQLDVPELVLRRLAYVIASVHAQPTATEKSPEHVRASREMACRHPHVTAIGHIDRYVQHLAWPDLEFFQLAASCGTAIEINANYLRRFGCLDYAGAWRVDWGATGLLAADVPLSLSEFADEAHGDYMDYRYAHLIALMIRAGTPMAIGMDWHLPHDPDGVDLEGGKLGPEAEHRLERLGNWLALREIPAGLVITSSLAWFELWLGTPKESRHELLTA